jgi:hypothetical protein
VQCNPKACAISAESLSYLEFSLENYCFSRLTIANE